MNINDRIEQIRNAETIAELQVLEEMIDADIDAAVAEMNGSGRFPRYGYTTAQVFESAEEWEEWKRAEVAEAVAEAKQRLAETE